MNEDNNYQWDFIQQKHKWMCRPTRFHIGLMDYGMKWGIIIFGKKIYEHETNWREKLRKK